MYGLMNKAVEGLVRSKFGDATWDRIRSDAGLPDEPFLSMEQYPDEVTYKLVGSACSVLNLPADAVLKEFGIFWTVYSAEIGYGELLNTVGSTLPEFLKNLDQMHTRIQLTFPHLKPPSFSVTDETDSSLVLHYFSDRPGLAPLVVGMIGPLGDRFGLETATVVERAETPRPHDLFRISWKPRAGGHGG